MYLKQLFFLLATVCLLWAQAEHPVTGRRIAPMMGIGGAEWLERSERELEEMPETAIDKLGLKPGMVVADVGAGVGYFTVRLAKRVGKTGKVYAADVQPEMLTTLKKRAAEAKLTNIQPILSSESDPRLPAKCCDVILMVDVYHELSRPQVMLQKMRQALKDDGRLVLLEYRKEDPHIPIRSEHKMSAAEAKAEVEAEGFQLEKLLKDLPRQHILIFRKHSM
jgi:ubiquinone/menaquinone biosynthesis C-methylase UbiE